MSLNVSGLAAWTDENKLPLIKKSVLGGRTLQFITVQPDIKSSAAINIIDSTLSLQAGGCGWNAAGTTALSQRDIDVCPVKINESICLDTLESYWVQTQMQPGSYNTDIPFEQIFAEEKADKIQALVDDYIWKGGSPSFSAYSLCNGFIRLFENTAASGTSVNGNTSSATAITAANIIGLIDNIVAVVPSDIIDAEDLVLFVGYDTYRTYSLALRNANLYHYTGAETNDFMQVVPGTNVKVVAVRGLNSTNRMFLSRGANMYFGTDLLNDFEDFSIFYSEDNDEVRFRFKGKLGVQVAFPEFVVRFKLV